MQNLKRQPTNLLMLLKELSASERIKLLQSLSPEQALAILYDWRVWARENQCEPTQDYFVWLVMAGRGFGKTRTGAEFVKDNVASGKARRISLIGRTAADVRDVMIEGESGLLAVHHPKFRPKYEPSKRRVVWQNGAVATAFSADEPDLLRGPQSDLIWGDEFASWRYDDAWSNAEFGLRLGEKPKAILTTTPKPIPRLKEVLKDSGTFLTLGSTFDNSDNLPERFISKIREKYENTRLGRQELFAEILDDIQGALWTRKLLEDNRVKDLKIDLVRVVVAVDVAVGGNAETGIVVCGTDANKHAYVIADYSLSGTPLDWANAVVTAFHTHNADKVVCEKNQGGNLIEANLRTVDKFIPIKLVHASRGKVTRAEPVVSLYEQGKVHHVGFFAELEDQMTTWIQGETSPDRLDALVWGITELCLEKKGGIVTVF